MPKEFSQDFGEGAVKADVRNNRLHNSSSQELNLSLLHHTTCRGTALEGLSPFPAWPLSPEVIILAAYPGRSPTCDPSAGALITKLDPKI